MAAKAGPLSEHDLEASEIAEVGYKRPPRSTQFKKGQSGNPRGRPRNQRRQIPYDTLLGQMVTIREDGRERRVTAAEAFLLQLTRTGLQGDSSSARASLQAIETARAKVTPEGSTVDVIRICWMGSGVNSILDTLGMGIKRHPLDEKKVRWELNPWIVDAALARLGSRHLNDEEQLEVLRVTRTPETVKWPNWWTVFAT
jgi:hypothetical protein